MKSDEADVSEAALLTRAATLGVEIPANQRIAVVAGARRLAENCRLLRAFKAAHSNSPSTES